MSSRRLMNSGLKWPSAPIRPPGDVRGHDEHDVLEVDRAALAVGQPPVVHDLQQHAEDVGVGLLDLVEQDDGVGPAADRLGELAALVVPHVARGRADEARHRVLLHVLRHVDAHHRVLRVEEELRQRARQLGLADAGRAHEEEGADRAVGVLQPGARAADRVGDGADRLVLADDAVVQALLHVDELLDLGLHEPADRDAGPARHDLGHVLGVDDVLEELEARLRLVAARLELGEAAPRARGCARTGARRPGPGRPRAARARARCGPRRARA